MLESKAYYWCQAMAEMYPQQMQLYFENDIYACYVLEQNVNAPLDMRIDYQTYIKEEEL